VQTDNLDLIRAQGLELVSVTHGAGKNENQRKQNQKQSAPAKNQEQPPIMLSLFIRRHVLILNQTQQIVNSFEIDAEWAKIEQEATEKTEMIFGSMSDGGMGTSTPYLQWLLKRLWGGFA